MNIEEKIDVVIPWVDGSDPIWNKKKNEYLSGNDESVDEMKSNNRFDDYGTLKYLFRSIEMYMPWVNNVFLVTDHQVPKWLDVARVKVVDHTEFIDGELPTFNSNVIVTSVYKISELSENFILMNDDLVLWNRNLPEDYFINELPVDVLVENSVVPFQDGFFHISQNGTALVNKIFNKREVMKNNFRKFFNLKYGFNQVRTLLSIPYGGFVGFYNPHLALAYRKSDFKNFEKIGMLELRNTWSNRFREPSDINDWAVRYYRNVKGDFVPGKLNGLYLTVGDFKKTVKVGPKVKMLVINDDGVRDEEILHNLEKILNDKFFEKSKYEL
ncbi:capsule biosynthesis protein CapG [Weissella confusa]|uniref:Stealth CR1 domain-containing protein n=1 Tax=Weissella fermenti TaxID=2987699 RepID=A0ABT6D5F4_9LACO|nr:MULTISPECIES: Stealth CR1 domain-containing protein [Weissella]MBJ7687545.1 capsule biosynthesis protein CapG [Weissella confusa]MCW0927462.1 Stealth CR1 domain-containing protein [Weissella sp. LMG 11983]MDF9299913.1 Stealth CR1 domain-containing protein [Weissella sp. BK2]